MCGHSQLTRHPGQNEDRAQALQNGGYSASEHGLWETLGALKRLDLVCAVQFH